MNLHNTPLRYPGGKQRLAPFIIGVLRESKLLGGHYAEPFAGGAGLGIHLLLTAQVEHIHLNDSSPAIFAFWRSVLRQPDDFCRMIAGASLTIDEWRRQRHILTQGQECSPLEFGFSLFYLNRCNRSGIPNGGVIGGLSQIGSWKMDARFPRNELIRRVETIAAREKQITVSNMDAEVFIKSRVPGLPRKTLVYCDPPYFRQGNRLYLNYYRPDDHAKLAATIQKCLRRPWLVSYDNVPQIKKCYRKVRALSCKVQYNAARAYVGTEIFFISNDLEVPENAVGLWLSGERTTVSRQRSRTI